MDDVCVSYVRGWKRGRGKAYVHVAFVTAAHAGHVVVHVAVIHVGVIHFCWLELGGEMRLKGRKRFV